MDITQVAGNHPYADKFPMLPEPELVELAESIKTVGLLQPVVLTEDRLVLDGRNRLAACERAGVEPTFTTYEGDDLAEFVIASNVTRRNMSTGARAMSTALVLVADGRRENGRWKRGSVIGNDESVNTDLTWAQRLKECGLVLDFTPALAQEVIDGHIALDAAYKAAQGKRDEKKREAEEEERIAQEEEEAESYLKDKAPEFLAQVESGKFENHREARAVYLERDRAEKRKQEIEKRDTEERIRREADRIKAFLSGYRSAREVATGENKEAQDVLKKLNHKERNNFSTIQEGIQSWPKIV